MGVLADRLQKQSESLKKRKEELQAQLKDWNDSLRNLYRQIEDWLNDCDPENLIERSIDLVSGKDPSFGEHQVPALKLKLVDDTIRFEPLSRNLAAFVKRSELSAEEKVAGAVELIGLGGRTYYLFQLSDQHWYVQSGYEKFRRTGSTVVPLTRELFERIVQETFYENA